MESTKVITPKIEKYPNKPITILIPWSAGSPTDLIARILEKLSLKYLHQPIIVVNRPGGTGTIAWNELSASNPDGYTIGISSCELLLQPLFVSTKYDYATALDPLAQITATPFVMFVKADQPWQSVNDLISYAKQHPGQVKFGHSGIGSLGHIVGETFCKETNITMNQVPFQGAPEVISALLGGHIQVAILNPGSVKNFVQNGTIKILAVASKKHLTDPILADAKTFQEQGINIFYNSRYGIAVPKETPMAIKDALAEELKKIITDPEFKKSVENLGLQYEYLGPKESEERWLTDRRELTKALQETGILDLIKSQKQ
ncbi:tripartite tricarboxylate transporter substrate binding protein [Pelorhabdus rhamnosifermentans]|uniref:tripartite tricarboxylate transporter substrate binding protein n=1 Tax=Pelorhabdus rhamnosifermentans TaxID=2772457 RepID=UPI001C0613DB|nr:tripartite tricarboxylate transporter substrate binding protein [Pelorhabdus rhamnosifermentans]